MKTVRITLAPGTRAEPPLHYRSEIAEPNFDQHISPEQAFAIVESHGFKIDEPTAVDTTLPGNPWVEGTDFLSEFGQRGYYDLGEVRDWLGY